MGKCFFASMLFCGFISFAHSAGIERNLPDGLDAKDTINWLTSNKKSNAKIVQVKEWNTNKYVITACVMKDSTLFNISKSPKGECGDESFDVYIGVISYDGHDYNFDYRTDVPISMNITDDCNSYFFKLDLAPYRVNESDTAIGFRRVYFTGYTGGGIGEEQLLLFMPHEKKLHKILDLSVKSYDVMAELSNPDGSRDPSEYTYKSTLHVLKTKTSGFYDYLVKTGHYKHDGKQAKPPTEKKYYIWSQKKLKYIPKSRELVTW
jgi:hypothetical protein